MTQVIAQLKAAGASVLFAFVASLILVKVVDVALGFVADEKYETEGLDRSEHGEVGFDLGPTLELVPERAPAEPRAALRPPIWRCGWVRRSPLESGGLETPSSRENGGSCP